MTVVPSHPVVRAFVDAVNAGDRAALWAALAEDATMVDAGTERVLDDWVELEIFSSHARMEVDSQSPDGLYMTARYHNDNWGNIDTVWTFTVADGKIRHFETGPP